MAERYASRTLREIARILATRFLGILIILAVVIAGTWVLTLYAPRWYRCEAKLLARPGRTVDPLETPNTTTRDEVTLFIATQREIIESDFVLASALMRLQGRAIQPTTNPTAEGLPTGDYQWYSTADVERFIAENYDWVEHVRENAGMEVPAGVDGSFTQTFWIRTDWQEDANRTPEGRSPREYAAEQAYRFTRFLTDAYLLRHSQLRTRTTRESYRQLAGAPLTEAREELRQAEKALEDFIKQPGVQGNLPVLNMMLASAGIEPGTAAISTRAQSSLNDVEVALMSARSLKAAFTRELAKLPDEKAQIEAILQAIREGKDIPGGDPFESVAVPDEISTNNPIVGDLQAAILALKLQVNRLEERFTAEYEDLSVARAELAKAKREMHAELKRQADRIDQRIDALEAQKQALEAIVTSRKGQMDKLAMLAAEYGRLRNNRDQAEEDWRTRRQDVQAAQMAQQLAENPWLVNVIDPATPVPADEPRRPILWLNVVIAALAGLVLALIYAFLSDYFDHTLKSIDEAERYLGLPVLASVPKVRGRIVRSRGG